MSSAAEDDPSPAGDISLANALVADNDPAGREIRPRDQLDEFIQGNLVESIIIIDQD